MVELDQGGRLAGRASVEPILGVCQSVAEHSFILRTADQQTKSWRIVPDLSAHVIVHFSGTSDTPVPERASVSGARTVFCDASTTGRTFSVGIRLAPGALASLTRVPAREFVNSSTPLAELWPQETSRLMSRLVDTTTPEAARDSLLTFLSEIACRSQEPDWRIRGYSKLLQAVPDIRLDPTAHALGLGTRTLRRACVEHVGLRPKRMARITRVYRAIAASMTRSGSTGTSMSAAAGFTDQAHMIREFRALLGETPREYCARRSVA